MTKEEQVAALWELLWAYGIETMEQFQAAYAKHHFIDISAFVEIGECPYFPRPNWWSR